MNLVLWTRDRAAYNQPNDNYFTAAEELERAKELQKELLHFQELARARNDGAVGLDGQDEISKFSCGKRTLDYGVNMWSTSSSRSGGGLRLVVAIDDVSGQLMACLKCPAHRSPLPLESVVSKVRLLRRYRHLNIVEYKGACVREGSLFVLMEMCDGGSIASIILRFGALDEELAARYTRQILSGLAYLHLHGIIHRHLTCSTCLVTTTGHVKLADFGLCFSMRMRVLWEGVCACSRASCRCCTLCRPMCEAAGTALAQSPNAARCVFHAMWKCWA